MQIKSAEDLIVYQKAYRLAMEIFELSKAWPKEEKYALIDQIRRSSRSVCANLREAWAKRRYEAHFLSKLTDSDGENSETDTWLDFAKDCQYLNENDHGRLSSECKEIGALLGSMIKNPAPFLVNQRSEDRGQRTEVRGQRSAVRCQKSGFPEALISDQLRNSELTFDP